MGAVSRAIIDTCPGPGSRSRVESRRSSGTGGSTGLVIRELARKANGATIRAGSPDLIALDTLKEHACQAIRDDHVGGWCGRGPRAPHGGARAASPATSRGSTPTTCVSLISPSKIGVPAVPGIGFHADGGSDRIRFALSERNGTRAGARRWLERLDGT